MEISLKDLQQYGFAAMGTKLKLGRNENRISIVSKSICKQWQK
jgi:hypothetical protein